MPNTYSEKEYITALYKCYDNVYLNDIQHSAPKPYHYSATVWKDCKRRFYISYNETIKIKGGHHNVKYKCFRINQGSCRNF